MPCPDLWIGGTEVRMHMLAPHTVHISSMMHALTKQKIWIDAPSGPEDAFMAMLLVLERGCGTNLFGATAQSGSSSKRLCLKASRFASAKG